MTYSLALKGGDLVPAGSQLAVVDGVDKLRQDLQIWLIFRYGTNTMHPAFGSALESYIGGVINSNTQAMTYKEILRVLTNYQLLQTAAWQANPSIFSLSELLYSVDSVNVAITYDTVYGTIQVSNPSASATVTISTSV